MTCLLLSALAYSQKEANNWFFGKNAGLTWNTTQELTVSGIGTTPDATLKGLPTSMSGSKINTLEGCFSLSDSEGNLLFYSDGMTVWNKNHEPMANGKNLTGHNSSVQSGIIMPYPNATNKFIAISINQFTNNGLAYSIIDMELNGGLGDVVSDYKCIPFVGGSGAIGEAVSAIPHSNGKDFWIIAPGRGTTTYMNAWLVTPDGVQVSSPRITTLPTNISVNHNGPTGYLKFTPNGKYFVWPSHNTRQILYGEFDASQGTVLNVKQITSQEPYTYGVDFSTSGKHLFISYIHSNKITIYDFSQLVKEELEVFKTIVLPSKSAGIQLGPDQRIYACAYEKNYVYVIDNPEEYDNLRAYQLPDGFMSGSCQFGLPSFSASWFLVSGDDGMCVNTPITYTMKLGGISKANYVVWNFGDGNVITEPLSSGNMTMFKEHIYKYAKNYDVTISIYDVNDVLLKETLLHTKVNRCSIPVNHNITNMKY